MRYARGYAPSYIRVDDARVHQFNVAEHYYFSRLNANAHVWESISDGQSHLGIFLDVVFYSVFGHLSRSKIVVIEIGWMQ